MDLNRATFLASMGEEKALAYLRSLYVKGLDFQTFQKEVGKQVYVIYDLTSHSAGSSHAPSLLPRREFSDESALFQTLPPKAKVSVFFYRIEDVQNKIFLNGPWSAPFQLSPQKIRILNELGRALQPKGFSLPDFGDRLNQYFQAIQRPLIALKELLSPSCAVLGTTPPEKERNVALLQEQVTPYAYIDPYQLNPRAFSAVSEQGTPHIILTRPENQIYEGRAPLILPIASSETLTALLSGLSGHVWNGNTFEMVSLRQKVVAPLVDEIRQNPPFSWNEFRTLIAQATFLTAPERQILLSNFQSTNHISFLNPNRDLDTPYGTMDKTQLENYSTEALFAPSGVYRITSRGLILQGRRILNDVALETTVQMGEWSHWRSQHDFYTHRVPALTHTIDFYPEPVAIGEGTYEGTLALSTTDASPDPDALWSLTFDPRKPLPNNSSFQVTVGALGEPTLLSPRGSTLLVDGFFFSKPRGRMPPFQVHVTPPPQSPWDLLSVSFWIKPAWNGGEIGPRRVFISFNSSDILYAQDGFFYFDIGYKKLGLDIRDWKAGTWHYVTGWVELNVGKFKSIYSGKDLTGQNMPPHGPGIVFHILIDGREARLVSEQDNLPSMLQSLGKLFGVGVPSLQSVLPVSRGLNLLGHFGGTMTEIYTALLGQFGSQMFKALPVTLGISSEGILALATLDDVRIGLHHIQTMTDRYRLPAVYTARMSSFAQPGTLVPSLVAASGFLPSSVKMETLFFLNPEGPRKTALGYQDFQPLTQHLLPPFPALRIGDEGYLQLRFQKVQGRDESDTFLTHTPLIDEISFFLLWDHPRYLASFFLPSSP